MVINPANFDPHQSQSIATLSLSWIIDGSIYEEASLHNLSGFPSNIEWKS
jgi:hypothetical protein